MARGSLNIHAGAPACFGRENCAGIMQRSAFWRFDNSAMRGE